MEIGEQFYRYNRSESVEKAKHPLIAYNLTHSSHANIDREIIQRRAIGNQAVQRLFKSGVIQAKLNIGAPNDIYEQEADRVAEQVMRMPEPAVQTKSNCNCVNGSSAEEEVTIQSRPFSVAPLIRRQEDEEEEEKIQTKSETGQDTTLIQRQTENEEEEPVQTKMDTGQRIKTSPKFEQTLQNIRVGGQPLDLITRKYFEPRFGIDFSNVRVHTNNEASNSARSINAQAYTVGRDIVFGAGHYAPESESGKRLLAHELTHVIQNPPFVSLQPQNKQPAIRHFLEGEGIAQDDDYLIWGTWLEGDTTLTFFDRTIPKWLVWRYGNVVDAGVQNRIMDYMRGLTKITLLPVSDLVPGNQYFIWIEKITVQVVDSLVYNDKVTRENIRKEGGKQAQKREEQAGLSSATEGKAVAKAQPAPAPAQVKEGKDEPPVPINESTYIPEKRTGLNVYRPNAEALPAKITGPDMQTVGGIGTYRMQLDYSIAGHDQLSQVVEAMNWINYHWERYDITPMVEKGMKEQVEKEKKRQVVSTDAEVGKMAATGRRAENAVSDIKDDVGSAASGLAHPVQASSTGDPGDIVVKALANYESLELLPASIIISAGGIALGALADLMGGSFQEREIPWPKREGYFLVRCIAQPSPQGPNGEQQRYASVAVKTIEVRDVKKLAINALDMPKTQIKEKELEIMIANQKQPPDAEEISRLGKELEYLKKVASSSAQDVIQASIDKKEEELKTATGYRIEQLKDELTVLRSQKALADKRVEGLKELVRPQASFASKVTGETYPLLLQLGFRGMDGEKCVYELSDVTSRDTRGSYVGKGNDAQTAAWNAVRDFAGHNDYGRGTIAIRMPEGTGFNFPQPTIESSPKDTELVKKRLSDLVTILVVLGLFVPGVGEAAAVLGAGLAAEHLYSRYKAGTLRLDASAVSDAIGVLGAAAVGVGNIAKFRLVKSAEGFALAAEEGEAKALQEAVEALAGAQKFAQGTALGNKIFMAGGVIWGNLSVLNNIMSINDLELRGQISHAEARRRKAQAVMDGIQNNLLVIAAGMSGPKEQAVKAEEPIPPPKSGRGVDKPTPPTDVPKIKTPAEQVKVAPGETSGVGEPSKVPDQAIPPKEIIVPKDKPSGTGEVTKESPSPVVPPKDLPVKEPAPKEGAPVVVPGETTVPVAEAPTAKPKVVAVAVAADGINQITVLEDGSIYRNSANLSEPIRNTYDEFLKNATGDRQALAVDLDNRLKAIEQKAKMEDPLAKQAAAKEAAVLETDLRNFASQSLAAETGITQINMQKLTEAFSLDEVRVFNDILGPVRFRYFARRSPQTLRRLARAWSVSATDPVVRQAIMEIVGMDTRLMTDSKLETVMTDLAYMQAIYPGKFSMKTLQAYLKYLRRGDIVAAKAELKDTINVIEGKKGEPAHTGASGKPSGVLESEGASPKGSTFTSASAQTEKSMTTSIRADIAEAEAYKAALIQHNEIGLQRPTGANIPGTDFITAKIINGEMWVIITDVKMSTISKFPTPSTTVKPAWIAEVRAAVAEGRLILGNNALEVQIRGAVDANRIQMRQVNVDYSTQGQGSMTGF